MESSINQQKGLLLQTFIPKMCPTSPFYWYFYCKEIEKSKQTPSLVQKAIRQYKVQNDRYLILEVIAEEHLTYPLCETAIENNGMNLQYVPIELIDRNLCELAVKNDPLSLEYVPKKFLRGKKGKELCELAISLDGFAIEFVPPRFLTSDLVYTSLKAPLFYRTIDELDGTQKKVCRIEHDSILEFVPKELLTKDLIDLSITTDPKSIRDIPDEFLSKEYCLYLIEKNPLNIQFLSGYVLDRKIVDRALKKEPKTILYLPENQLTKKRCLMAVRRDSTISIEKFPKDIQDYIAENISLPPMIFEVHQPIYGLDDLGNELIQRDDDQQIHDLSIQPSRVNRVIYYISDLHLEHQLKLEGLPQYQVQRRIKERIQNLVSSCNRKGILLVGGDVADNEELAIMFYKSISTYALFTKIFTVLGNHELWDGNPLSRTRSLQTIINDYREKMPASVTLLENDLYVAYKGRNDRIIGETILNQCTVEELKQVCHDSTFLLLGGIGFTGKNVFMNANNGLYGCNVNIEEDLQRTERFQKVYEKVKLAAEDIQVIVLTHTPVQDWLSSDINENWIYVNGHTHHNAIEIHPDGAKIVSDNQIGYKPKQWQLKSFLTEETYYDIFKDYKDGIYPISLQEYLAFNSYLGISCQKQVDDGNIIMLKRNEIYLFLLKKEDRLYLLEGGIKYTLVHDLQYYYDNLPIYYERLIQVIQPYRNQLDLISKDIRKIGGSGTIHGCIVDIDFYNHVFLNPFDGKWTPYYATDTTNKIIYPSIRSLLEQEKPNSLIYSDGSLMIDNYQNLIKKEALVVLNDDQNKCFDVQIPTTVLDRDIYKPSRIMKVYQYAFDYKIIRIWNDSLLTKTLSTSSNSSALQNETKVSKERK